MSHLRANTISDAAGTGPVTLTGQSASKAWWSYTKTPALAESYNVSSLSDIGTGIQDLSFTDAFSASFAPIGNSRDDNVFVAVNTLSLSVVRCVTRDSGGALIDVNVTGSAHGDLA